MSGGYFDYINVTLLNEIESIKENYSGYSDAFHEDLKNDVKELLYKLVTITADYMHDIDYHLSGDSIIDDQDAFLKEYIERIKEEVLNESTK